MKKRKYREMSKAIEAAWANPNGAELRAKLFPEGKPTPEVFVQRISEYTQKKLEICAIVP